MSFADWPDKALWGETSLFWVNKQPTSLTTMPKIGFSRATFQVRGLSLPGIRCREILSCTCLFWFRYLFGVHVGISETPSGEQWCWGMPAAALRLRYHTRRHGCAASLSVLLKTNGAVLENLTAINLHQSASKLEICFCVLEMSFLPLSLSNSSWQFLPVKVCCEAHRSQTTVLFSSLIWLLGSLAVPLPSHNLSSSWGIWRGS